MSNSYQCHKSQVEDARKDNGEFGTYSAGESQASLPTPGEAEESSDRVQEMDDQIEAGLKKYNPKTTSTVRPSIPARTS